MARVLVTESIADEGLSLLREGADVVVLLHPREDALRKVVGSYEGLVVRSRTVVSEHVLAAARQLLVVGRAGTGVENIDIEAATRRGVVVVNAPYGNTISVAEHTLGMLLSLARNIPKAAVAMSMGRWEKSCCQGIQVRGKVLGIVGLGRVGAAVAERARGLEMRIVAHDPFVGAERARQLGAELLPLSELLQKADFVSLHLPESDKTCGLIGHRELALMKPTAYLINCARGRLVDERALVETLEGGRIAGAGLDVFAEEPIASDHPLLGLDNVVLTPHLAGSTAEAHRDTSVEIAQEVLDVLGGRLPRYPVNAPSLSEEELAIVRPHLDLAQRLGRFYGQLGGDHVEGVEVAFAGDVPAQRLDLILSAALAGLLRDVSEEHVNWINAQVIARERGIRLTARQEPLPSAGGWANLIELRVVRGDEVEVVAGTVLRGTPHIVQIDGYWLDFAAEGLLLVSEHIEQPGILGRVGTVLGGADVNIHFVQVGRRGRGGPGMLVLGLDDVPSEQVLGQLACLPSIRSAKLIVL